MSLFKRTNRAAQVAELDVQDEWSVSEGQYEGRPMVVRRNEGLAVVAGHPAFGHQVGVAVPFVQPDDRGFPGEGDLDVLGRIEEDLVREFGAGNECLLAAVITTSGMREFVLYTSDPEAAQRRHAELAARHPAHEVQLMIQPDPGWSVYGELSPG